MKDGESAKRVVFQSKAKIKHMMYIDGFLNEIGFSLEESDRLGVSSSSIIGFYLWF